MKYQRLNANTYIVAAILFSGHPYIGGTTVPPNTLSTTSLLTVTPPQLHSSNLPPIIAAVTLVFTVLVILVSITLLLSFILFCKRRHNRKNHLARRRPVNTIYTASDDQLLRHECYSMTPLIATSIDENDNQQEYIY